MVVPIGQVRVCGGDEKIDHSQDQITITYLLYPLPTVSFSVGTPQAEQKELSIVCTKLELEVDRDVRR